MAKDKVYMKGFKGFGPGMVCEPNSEHRKEYKENTTYEEEGGKICGSGVMHFCENPLDVLSFYPPVNDSGELNEYATVEALAPVESDEKKEKSCTKKLHIGVKLSLNELLKAAIDFTWSKVDKSKEQTIIFRQQSSNSGDYSVSSNSGDYSVSSNSGYKSVSSNSGYKSVSSNSGNCSVSSNSGNCSVSSNSGNCSVSSNSGYKSVSSNSGDYSVSSNSGDYSVSSNSGDYSVSSNSGYKSVSSNSGDYSVSSVEGKESVAVATGRESKVKGKIGCWIACAEWGFVDGEWHIIDFQSTKVDGKTIKEDVFYILKNGKFEETV